MTQATVVSPFTAEQEKILTGWTSYYPYPMMGLIEAMRQVQEWHLCIQPDDEDYIASLFKTARAHVHEVATFFPFFTQKPTGRKRIGLCRGISCALAGSDTMAACLEKKLGVPARKATPDDELSWEPMECLGACDYAPALIINEELKGRADEGLIEGLR